MKSPIWARWSLLTALDACVLVRLVPDWARLGSGLRAPHRWIESSGADGAGLTLGLATIWVAAAWLALGLLLTLLAVAPGPLGARAGTWASRMVPAVLVRAVAGAAGLSIIITPATADAQPALRATTSSRPIDAHAPGLPASNPAAPESAPRWPTDPPIDAPAPETPAAGLPSPGRPAAPVPAAEVTVVPGDSLWLISAQRLEGNPDAAAVTTEWPRWYAANRQQIGTDPGLLRPGQVLHAPAPDGPPPAAQPAEGGA